MHSGRFLNYAIMVLMLVGLWSSISRGQAPRAPAAANSPTPVNSQPRTFKETFPTPLLQAIALKDESAVRTLLSRRTTLRNALDGDDYTKIPILLAAVTGDAEIVKVLLDGGANLETHGQFQMTALMLAALKGNLKVVEVLLARGAKANAQSDIGATALMTASRDGFTDIVRALLGSGADANAATNTGFTALMAAADDPVLVNLLLDAGAKTDAINADGQNAACFAIKAMQQKKLAALTAHDPQTGLRCKK